MAKLFKSQFSTDSGVVLLLPSSSCCFGFYIVVVDVVDLARRVSVCVRVCVFTAVVIFFFSNVFLLLLFLFS